jgi:hypothetical protein
MQGKLWPGNKDFQPIYAHMQNVQLRVCACAHVCVCVCVGRGGGRRREQLSML